MATYEEQDAHSLQQKGGAASAAALIAGTSSGKNKYALGLNGGSSHARMARGMAKSTKVAKPGTHVALKLGGASVQGAAAAQQGVVVSEIPVAGGETLLQVVSPDGLSQIVPASAARVIERKSQGNQAHEVGAEDSWVPEEYSPEDNLCKSIMMVIFGALVKRRKSGGDGWEYKRQWCYLNILLVFVPMVFAFNYGKVGDTPTFICSFLAIIPLAGLLGHFTEDLACHVGSALGALLNASFGNATEIIISVFAVKEQLFDVIKNSMLGSVMSNMLLVLGCAFISRSLPNGTDERRDEIKASALWTFNAESANVFASLLLLATFCLVVPTAYAQLHILPHHEEAKKAALKAVTDDDAPTEGGTGELLLPPVSLYCASRATAIIMILLYIIFLYFQVKNNEVFDGSGSKDEETGEEGEEEEEEKPKMSKLTDIGGLAVITLCIAFVSEFLVGALESATKSMGLNEAWVAVILIPIVGNAAEHATAIVSSYKGDMECAVGVAVGSSIQIAGFAVPLLVIISWIVNGHDPDPITNKEGVVKPGALDMNFHPFSMTVMTLSVIVVNTILTDGRGSWLEGMCLLASYAVIGAVFWYVPAASDA